MSADPDVDPRASDDPSLLQRLHREVARCGDLHLTDVGVVMLSFNRREALSETLRLLVELSRCSGCELVVVDNASSDGSWEEICTIQAEYPQLITIRNATNLGVGDGRQIGWRRVSRQYILNVDDDTYVGPSAIDLLLSEMNANQGVALAYPEVVHAISGDLQTPDLPRTTRVTNFHGACHLVRSSAAAEVGDLDPLCKFGGEELDYTIRLRAQGYEILYVPEATAYHASLRRTKEADQWRRVQWAGNQVRVLFKHLPDRLAATFAIRLGVVNAASAVRAGGLPLAAKVLHSMALGVGSGRKVQSVVPAATVAAYRDHRLVPEVGNRPLWRKLAQRVPAPRRPARVGTPDRSDRDRPTSVLFVLERPTPLRNPVLDALHSRPPLQVRALYRDLGDMGRGWGDLERNHPSTALRPRRPNLGIILRDVLRSDVVCIFGYRRWPFVLATLTARLTGRAVAVRFDANLRDMQLKHSALELKAISVVLRVLFGQSVRAWPIGSGSLEFWRYCGFRNTRTIPYAMGAPLRVDEQMASLIRRDMKVADEQWLILFVGRLSPEKGPADLIEAVGRMHQGERCALLVVGDGELRDALEAQAADMRVTIHFAGAQRQQDLGSYYRAADVVVVPSHREAWGLVVNEALSCGTRVICSDRVQAGLELLRDGAGTVVPACDPQALADALDREVSTPREGRSAPEAMPEVSTDEMFFDEICALGADVRRKSRV